MKLVYQYMAMDQDDNGKFRLERVRHQELQMICLKLNKYE